MNTSRRIDYKILHTTGEKVYKPCADSQVNRSSKMSEIEKLKTMERRNRDDVSELIELNTLEDFDDLTRIDSHIDCLKQLLKKTREIHRSLEDALGLDEYSKIFDNDGTASSIKSEIVKFKESRSILKDVRSKPVKVESSSAQEKIRDDIDLCTCKVDSILESFPIDMLSSIEDIRLNIGKVTDSLATYNYLISKFVKADTSDVDYPLVLARAVEYVEKGRSKIEKLSSRSESSESSTNSSSRELELLNRLIDEISYIEGSLKKLETVDLTDFRDEELLEAQKEVKDKYHKCDILSEKITLLYSQIPVGHIDREKILDQHAKDEKSIRGIIDAYREKLKNEVVHRNVSKEKLVSSKSSRVSLKKFAGFDSALDIYSFQTEFEKLIAPSVQAKLLPDILKNDYLEGSALNAVKGLDKIDEIWARLKVSYGETEILLRNKMKEVEKVGQIWKGRDKSKKVQALSKLVFVMTDLQELASKHDIENDLYHGGGIQRVYEVLGNVLRDKFIRNNTEVTLSKKEKWVKLLEFIKT